MAVRLVEDWTSLKPEEYIGLSTDTKPLENNLQTIKAGASFYTLDTKAIYIFDGISTWYPM